MAKMQIIMIYYLVIIEMTIIVNKKRRMENNEEFNTTQKYENTIIGSNYVHESTMNDFDEYLKYDFVRMCHKSCTSGLSTKHNMHKEIDEEVVEYILQSSECSYSEGFITESASLFIPDSQENIPPLDLDIEPSIATLYSENTAIAENIVHRKIENLEYKGCNLSHNSRFICNLHQDKNNFDGEALNTFADDSKSSLSDLNTGSIINKLSTETNTAEETWNNVTLNSQYNSVFKKNITSSLICLYSVEEIHKKIKEHITLILKKSKTYVNWYTKRLDEIYYVIKNVNLFKNSNNKNYDEFFDALDVHILQLLDTISLRKHSKISVFDINEYAEFDSVLTKFIFNMNLYNIIGQLNLSFKKDLLPILCAEFVQLFEFIPIIPELISLKNMFNRRQDERLLLHVRIIYLICKENESRLRQIKSLILFFIEKLSLKPKRRTKESNITSEVKFNITKDFEVKSICSRDHSNLNFFIWEIHSDKIRRNNKHREENDDCKFDITIHNINHFRAVFEIFLFQHIIFLEYHNLRYEEYNEFLEYSFNDENCVFCLFSRYLEFVKIGVLALRK